MDVNKLPSLEDRLARQIVSRTPRRRNAPAQPEEDDRPSILGGGIRAGFNEFQALSGAALGAVGRATGNEGLAERGIQIAEKNFAEAQEFGRPDLETLPFKEGGSPLLPFIGFQAAKILPQAVGSAVLGAATGGTGLAAAVGGRAALAAGTGAARRTAAKQAVRGISQGAKSKARDRGAVGGLVAGGTVAGAGSLFSEAVEAGNATPEEARRALLLAPLSGVAEGLPQARIGKLLLRGGSAPGIARRVTEGVVDSAAAEGVTEGFQTSLENTFRPDLSSSEKAQRVVDAALTGGLLGGSFGAVGGIRRQKDTPPADLSTEDLAQSVTEDTTPTPVEPAAPGEGATGAPVTEAPFTGPQAEGQTELFQPAQAQANRPLADTPAETLVQQTERALAAANDPQLPAETREAAQEALAAVRQEVEARQNEAPASQLTAEQLGDQDRAARRVLEESNDPAQIEAAQARLQEVQDETTRRTLEAERENPAIPGLEQEARRPSRQEEQATQEQRRENRVRRLARQFIRSQSEDADPSIEAQRLGLTPFTRREFETRIDKTREELGKAATEVETARARKIEVDQNPKAKRETKKRAEANVKKAEKALKARQDDARKATAEMQLREEVIARAEAVGGDLQQLRPPPRNDPGETRPDPVADLQQRESPSARRQRRKALRNQDVTLDTPFRLSRADGRVPPVEISLRDMLDRDALQDRIQSAGLANTEAEARQMAVRASAAASQGAGNLRSSLGQVGVEATPVRPPQQSLETPTLQPGDIPPARPDRPSITASRPPRTQEVGPDPAREPVTGTGAPTTPGKAVFRPKTPPRSSDRGQTVEQAKEAAPPESLTQLIRAPSDARVEPPRTPQEAQTMVGRVVEQIRKAGMALLGENRYLELGVKVRRELLAWTDMQTLQTLFSDAFDQPQLQRLRELDNQKKKIIGFFSPLGADASAAFRKLNTDNQRKIMKIMELAAYDVSFEAPWADHKHLIGRNDADFLKQKHTEARKLYSQLQPNSGKKVLDDMAALNRADALETQIRKLHAVLETDFALQGRQDFSQVVGRRGYDAVARRQIREPRKIVEAMKKDREVVIKAAEDLIRQKNAEAARGGLSQTQLNRLKIMSDMLSRTTVQVKDEASFDFLVPYFHKGRFGDYRVSFNLAKAFDDQGREVNNRAGEQRLAETLARQGITGVGVQENGPSRVVMMKFETSNEAAAAFNKVQELVQDGTIEPGTLRKGSERRQQLPESAAHRFKEGLIERVRAISEATDDATADKAMTGLQSVVEDFFLETTPAHSKRRVLAHRTNAHGYSTDMHRAFVHRWQIGVTDAAAAITAAPRARVYQDMIGEIRESGRQPGNRENVQTDLLNEMRERDKVVDVKPNSLSGSIRALNHAWYLGMSPAYMLMTVAHVPIITLPRLGAQFGFRKSSQKLLEAAPEAARVVQTLLRESLNLRDFGEATFTNLSPEIMRREFLEFDTDGNPTAKSLEFVEMLQELAETATMDMGGQMRELGRVAEGRNNSVVDHITRTYGAPGYYSEMYSRLVTGIASYRMNKEKGLRGEELTNTTANMVHDTMLDYSSSNTGRRLGEKGFAGPVTPIVTAFQQYSFQVLGMLYREYNKLYKHNEADPARRAEARKFLAGHMAAVTTFAGTMGLPFAAPVSRALEAVASELFQDENEEPFDLDTSYRNFLADTFGKDIGEVVARGVPRAFGIDLSTRLGEQDLLPGSRLMSDRRFLLDQAGTMEAVSDAALRRLGSPVGVPASIAEAIPQLLAGDVAKAGATGAPIAVSNLFKSYQLTEKGYTDRNGNPAVITPTGYDVLTQALGVTPARKAELSTAKNSVRVFNMRTNARKTLIRNNISAAIQAGDREAAREWVQEAVAFDMNNPGTPITPSLVTTLTSRFDKSAVARALGVPRTTDLTNPAQLQLGRFANF